MSNVAVFAVGLLVTLLVAGAVSLLIWGAVIDGREEDQRRSELEPSDAVVVGPQSVGADGMKLGTVPTG